VCSPLSWIEILVDWFDKTIEFVEQGDGEELSIFFADHVMMTLLKEYVKLYMMLASLILVTKLVVQNFSNIS